MARSTISERLARQLDRESDELAGIPAEANLTPVHVATLDTLSDFLTMGEKLSKGGDTPPAVRTLMTFLRRCRPLMLEQLADVDPKALREFVADIRDRLSVIVETPIDDEGGGSDGSAGNPSRRPA